VTALSTGLCCQRAVMRGYDVCASHGGKAGEASKAILAAPYDPVAAADRQAKRARHRVYAQLRATGRAPKPVQESFQRLSGGLIVSAAPKPPYSPPSNSFVGTIVLSPASAPPCTAGSRMSQIRRGSCRRFTPHERFACTVPRRLPILGIVLGFA
jgi:hypothetical protein